MDIKLHRAHRIGRFINGKTRPIVAKFVYYPDRERVRKASQVLRDTDSVYAVSQQYPKEVQERRRALVPIMKQARLNGSEAYIYALLTNFILINNYTEVRQFHPNLRRQEFQDPQPVLHRELLRVLLDIHTGSRPCGFRHRR